MDSKIKRMLRCPKCQGRLRQHKVKQQLLGFDCAACRLRFPVTDGIGDFVIGDALPLGSDSAD